MANQETRTVVCRVDHWQLMWGSRSRYLCTHTKLVNFLDKHSNFRWTGNLLRLWKCLIHRLGSQHRDVHGDGGDTGQERGGGGRQPLQPRLHRQVSAPQLQLSPGQARAQRGQVIDHIFCPASSCPATLSMVNRGIYSDAYTTYYPLTSNPGNPGGTMMLTEEELQQRSVKASYVGGTNIGQRCH